MTVTVLGNFVDGSSGDGIEIQYESDITIGGPTNADKNVITHNTEFGVAIEGLQE